MNGVRREHKNISNLESQSQPGLAAVNDQRPWFLKPAIFTSTMNKVNDLTAPVAEDNKSVATEPRLMWKCRLEHEMS